MEKYFFISDLHFGYKSYPNEKNLIKKFEKLCESIIQERGELFILGDLFDYWFEYKTAIQKYSHRIITQLENLIESGINIHYLIGNHDFAHLGFFNEILKIKPIETHLEIYLNGKKFFLAHGDGLVKNDLGYKILKLIVRNKSIQKLYSSIHPTFGIRLASYFSKKSRYYTSEKDYGDIDGLLEFAKLKIEDGFDYVLFGHGHRREFRKIENGFYINLGSWIDSPCYGIFESEFKVIDL